MAAVQTRSEEEIVKTAMTNTVVLRRILSNLNFTDLKDHCSLVSKFWNYEVRSYIRDFCQCGAKISGVRPCSDLFRLNKQVDQMAIIVPINSLSIDLDSDQCHGENCTFRRDEHSVYENILKKLQIKYFSISCGSYFEAHRCPAKKFARAVICGKTSLELRTLKFGPVPPEFQYFFDKDWTPWFPMLTVFSLGRLDPHSESLSEWLEPQKDFFLKLIDGAPNLKKIGGSLNSDALEILPKAKYVSVNEFHLFIKSAKHEQICWDLIEAKPEISCLLMDVSETLPAYRISFFRMLEQLFTASSKTLGKLKMRSTVFPLDQVSFPALTNLKSLEITTGADPGHVLHMLRRLDYPKRLPALAEIRICSVRRGNFQQNAVIGVIGLRSNKVSFSYVLQPSLTVKKLYIEADVTKITFPFIKPIFPAIKELELCLRDAPWIRTPYTDLWASWPQCERISIIEGRGTLGKNHDYEFLGISSDELEVLHELDDETLEQMHIVPARPSIVGLSRLKVLKIEFEREQDPNNELLPGQAFLSRVTGFMALRRLTKAGTTMQFVCRHRKILSRLKHLHSFASVIFEKQDLP